MVCVRNESVNTLRKGDDDDDDNLFLLPDFLFRVVSQLGNYRL